MFAIVFGMIVILTILTDPDPSVASDIQPVEVRMNMMPLGNHQSYP